MSTKSAFHHNGSINKRLYWAISFLTVRKYLQTLVSNSVGKTVFSDWWFYKWNSGQRLRIQNIDYINAEIYGGLLKRFGVCQQLGTWRLRITESDLWIPCADTNAIFVSFNVTMCNGCLYVTQYILSLCWHSCIL